MKTNSKSVWESGKLQMLVHALLGTCIDAPERAARAQERAAWALADIDLARQSRVLINRLKVLEDQLGRDISKG